MQITRPIYRKAYKIGPDPLWIPIRRKQKREVYYN